MARKRSRGHTRAKGIPDHIAEQMDNVARFPCIYVLRANDIYKIGKTINSINERFYGWWRKVGKPNDFEIIYCIPVVARSEKWVDIDNTVDQAERGIHRHFAARRVSRRIEHFRLTANDIAYIKSISEYRDGEFVRSE